MELTAAEWRAWIAARARQYGPEVLRTLVGWVGIGLVLAGVWGLWGWQCAAILGGLPLAGFYIYGEVRAVRASSEEVG